MKTKNVLLGASMLILALLMVSCKKENVTQNNTVVLPARFKVAIPSSLTSANQTLKSGARLKSDESTALKGNDIYCNLNTFIAIGKGAGDMVENIIGAIALYHIETIKAITYEGDQDHRTKSMVVNENVSYQGKMYRYMLTVTDVASAANADSGKAMQVFWNPSPIEGIAILKPYNIDRIHNATALETVFSIEYSEVSTPDYDSFMTVEIANFPMADPTVDPYAVKSLKMSVGKKGDQVDVYGNSEHPNAKFFTQSVGFDWAFVASGFESKNIAVAEVGLPPSTLDDSNRNVLLGTYSIRNVFTDQVNDWFMAAYGMHPDSSELAVYLQNAEAPGFFNTNGFIQAGVAPNTDYDQLVTRIANLTPFNPKTVDTLQPKFK